VFLRLTVIISQLIGTLTRTSAFAHIMLIPIIRIHPPEYMGFRTHA